jgi:hypothetical protein
MNPERRMFDSPSIPSTTSLAGIRAGDVVRIQQIMFDNLRAHCVELGMSEGDVVRCRVDGHDSLLLVTPAGRTVLLERGWARFIRVSDAGIAGVTSVATERESSRDARRDRRMSRTQHIR